MSKQLSEFLPFIDDIRRIAANGDSFTTKDAENFGLGFPGWLAWCDQPDSKSKAEKWAATMIERLENLEPAKNL